MGDILVNLNHLPDHDPFARERMFDDCNDIQSVVKSAIVCGMLCFEGPEKLGELHLDRITRVIEEATQRINELPDQPTGLEGP